MTDRDLSDWFDECFDRNFVWFAKRLSGNDTLANGAHQAGPYIPKSLLFRVLPGLDRPGARNPDVEFCLCVDSHSARRRVRAVWYNSRTRDESRITRLGGQRSALLDPANTGALCVFAFRRGAPKGEEICRVWLCRNESEENFVEDRIGPVEPGSGFVWHRPGALPSVPESGSTDCWMTPDELPQSWLSGFPSPAVLIDKTVQLRQLAGERVDTRLIRRRDCEYELFRSVEEATVLPQIRRGFASMEDFIDLAQSVLQRRKNRSGRSLELHVRAILTEEGLREGRDFSHNEVSEHGRRPDFLFPSVSDYREGATPDDRLRMLAVKTTCKDRWRQILREADRIECKHLLTLQEGVSEAQFREMRDANVQLVVPSPIFRKYAPSIRPHLESFEDFLAEVRRGAGGYRC